MRDTCTCLKLSNIIIIVKLGFLKTVQPNSFSKLIPAACNFKNNAQETYLFVLDL